MCFRYITSCRRIELSTADLTETAFAALTECVGDKPILDFSLADAERFQGWAVCERKQKLSETSANIYCKMISPVFTWAVERQYLPDNPWKRQRRYRIGAGEIATYTEDEVAHLLRAAGSDLWRARILLARTAGLRRSEILNLTLDDVDFAGRKIFVRPKRQTAFTWRWVPKDKDRRTVPLVAETERLLVSLAADMPAGQPYLMLTRQVYQGMLKVVSEGRLSERSLDRRRKLPEYRFNRAFSAMVKRAGIKAKSFHDLRRTCITDWAQSLSPKDLQQLAGHSEIDTTMRYYVKVTDASVDNARKVSENVLNINCAQNIANCAQTELAEVLEKLRQLLNQPELINSG